MIYRHPDESHPQGGELYLLEARSLPESMFFQYGEPGKWGLNVKPTPFAAAYPYPKDKVNGPQVVPIRTVFTKAPQRASTPRGRRESRRAISFAAS